MRRRPDECPALDLGPLFVNRSVEPDEVPRLKGQLRAVFLVVSDSRWRTLREIAGAANAPEASVSARLRDLRRPENGRYTVERRIVPGTNGAREYRLVR